MLHQPSDHSTSQGLRLLFNTVLCLVVGVLLASLINAGLVKAFGLTLSGSTAPLSTVAERMQLRLVAAINNLGTWAVPAAVALVLTYGRRWPAAAGLVTPGRFSQVGNALLVFLFGMPLVALAAYLNLQIELPQWMVNSEAQGNALLASVLQFDRPVELLVTMLVVAVVPAIGEELMFRGLVQGRLLPFVMSERLAIWTAAALFSAIHLEFAGFFPRLLLGVLLGYSYRWTRSLYVPMTLHFLFNGLQVVNTYYNGFVPDTEMQGEFSTLLLAGAFSLVVVIYLGLRAEGDLRATETARTGQTDGETVARDRE